MYKHNSLGGGWSRAGFLAIFCKCTFFGYFVVVQLILLTLNWTVILLIVIWKQTNNAFDPSAANWVNASRSKLVVSSPSLEEIATSPLSVVSHFRPDSSNTSLNVSLSKFCEWTKIKSWSWNPSDLSIRPNERMKYDKRWQVFQYEWERERWSRTHHLHLPSLKNWLDPVKWEGRSRVVVFIATSVMLSWEWWS